jgi:hypothetical protein
MQTLNLMRIVVLAMAEDHVRSEEVGSFSAGLGREFITLYLEVRRNCTDHLPHSPFSFTNEWHLTTGY